MPINTFGLADHYTPIQRRIFDDSTAINTLYEEHGERVTECLFLSQLVESLDSQSCSANLLAIASYLIDFELSQFQPPELIPLYEGPRFFKGEIIYLSDDALVSKITSNQFPTWQLLLTVVVRREYSLFPNVHPRLLVEFSAVSL